MSYPSQEGGTPQATPPKYDPPEIIPLGWIRDPQKCRGFKIAHGPIVPIYRQMDTPCWHWAGNYSRGYPVIKNRLSSRSPLRLIFEARGKRGHVESLCGHRDCINPKHHRVVPWDEHMPKIRHLGRDPKTGRFVKDTKEEK